MVPIFPEYVLAFFLGVAATLVSGVLPTYIRNAAQIRRNSETIRRGLEHDLDQIK